MHSVHQKVVILFSKEIFLKNWVGEPIKVIQDWENKDNQYSEEDRLVSWMDLILIFNSPSVSIGWKFFSETRKRYMAT